jgi:hypothetical protein
MLLDGRQSERALAIRRGTLRLLAALDMFALPEVTLTSGRRADLLGISRTGTIWIIEIKSSKEDLRADSKWPQYRAFCDQLFFATSPDVEESLFPPDAGFILADSFGGAVMRDAPVHTLAAASRKALLTRVARIGAARLTAQSYPDAIIPDNL